MPGGNVFGKDSCSWITLHPSMHGKHIASWVHSHVEGVECCFSSVDLHTQFSYTRIYPDLLGLVFEINPNGNLKKYDYYGFTPEGNSKLRNCKLPGTQFHDECWQKSYYTSKKHLVTFFDGPLKVYDGIPEINPQRELNSTEFSSMWEYLTIQESANETNSILDEVLDTQKSSQSNQSQDLNQDQTNIHQSQESNVLSQKDEEKCKGCEKIFKIDKLVQHVGHRNSKKCKAAYGEETYEKMKSARKEAVQKRKRVRSTYFKDWNARNRKERNEKQKIYDQKNKEVIYEKARQRKKDMKIANLEFEKRFKNFKNETKNGPSFGCHCCHRSLFYRGMFIDIFRY